MQRNTNQIFLHDQNADTYLIYASECKTRWGLGGTVINKGSCAGPAVTKIIFFLNYECFTSQN